MSIEFRCTNCGRQLRAPDHAVGQRCRCPECHLESLVPPRADFATEQPPGPQEATRPCPYCAEQIRVSAIKCRFCGSMLNPPTAPQQFGPAPLSGDDGRSQSGRVCSILSVVFGCVAFLLCPPLFGLAGLVLGIIGAVQSEKKTLAVVGIVLSIIGTIVGMIIGVALMSNEYY